MAYLKFLYCFLYLFNQRNALILLFYKRENFHYFAVIQNLNAHASVNVYFAWETRNNCMFNINLIFLYFVSGIDHLFVSWARRKPVWERNDAQRCLCGLLLRRQRQKPVRD